MEVRLSQESLDWLFEHRILFNGFRAHKRIKPGDYLAFHKLITVEPYCAIYEGNKRFSIGGNNLFSIGSFSYTWSTFPMDFSIGRYCSVAWDVQFPGPRHAIELLSTSPFLEGPPLIDMWSLYLNDVDKSFQSNIVTDQKRATIVGNDVWIGQGAMIMRGLSIGDGAVIASGSVVTKDVQPYAIVGGNPASFIRWRFMPDVIAELMDLRWWRYAFTDLKDVDFSNLTNTIHKLREILPNCKEFKPMAAKIMEMPHAGIVKE